MKAKELLEKTHELDYTASINSRYHQFLVDRYEFLDIIQRLLAAISSTGALAAMFAGYNVLATILWAVTVASTLAGADTLPIAKNWRLHCLAKRCWFNLRTELTSLQLRIKEAVGDEPLDSCDLNQTFRDWYGTLMIQRHNIEQREPPPATWLLDQCQRSENVSRYGKATYEEIVADLAEL